MGLRCKACGKLVSTARSLCPACHSVDVEWVPLSGKGRVATFTCIVIAPTFMVQKGYGRDNPYCTGVIELEEGPRVSARIVGVDASQPQTIKVGIPVEVDFSEMDPERPGLVFREASGS